MTTLRCLVRDCHAPVTHRVRQTWNQKTVHCCDQHIPGSKNPEPTPFYEVTPLTYEVVRGDGRVVRVTVPE